MKTRLSGMALFTAAALFIGFTQPFAPDLNPAGHSVLTAVLIAVGLWIFGTGWVPLSIGSMVMLLILTASGLKYATVFNGYTSRAIWILIPALFFGFALNTTGLGKRLAYGVIGLFRPSYRTLTLSWFMIGLLLSVLTPSITVRIAIVMPIAVATVEICRLHRGSNGAGFILLAAWSMVLIPGSGWLTGSLWGPVAMGLFDATPGLQGIITFESWSRAMLLPSAVLTLLFMAGLYRFMKPPGELSIDREAFQAEFRRLGPITFQEKATLTVLVAAFLLLVTGRLHHLTDVSVCLGAFVLLAAFGVIRAKDIGPGISWDLILFLGSVMGLGLIFQETGVSAFLSRSFTPAMGKLAAHSWLILFAGLILLLAWRFVDISQLNASLPFLVTFLPMLAADFGIHPLVCFFLMILAGNCFFLSYQQPFVIVGETLAGEARWTAGQLQKAGLIYLIACLLTLAVSIPYWRAVGLIR